MRYYLIAGEASGDLQGAQLIRCLRVLQPQAEYRAWGGDLMQEAGAELVQHYRQMAFMGPVEVMKHLRTVLRNLRYCKGDIGTYQPDVLILIDFSGFNLRVAEWVRTHYPDVRIFYYISPQVWASRSGRIEKMKWCVDRVFCIFPFEPAFYGRHGYHRALYVGHPLVKVVDATVRDVGFWGRHGLEEERPMIAFLPGSRRQEIERILPVMLEAAPGLPEGYQVVVACAPNVPLEYYRQVAGGAVERVCWVQGDTYQVLSHATIAAVASGTASLEAALFGVPQVVCYATNPAFYQLARRVVKVPYLSMVNLILDKPAVKELIQRNLTAARLLGELENLLHWGIRTRVLADYAAVRLLLGNHDAAERAAQCIVSDLPGK